MQKSFNAKLPVNHRRRLIGGDDGDDGRIYSAPNAAFKLPLRRHVKTEPYNNTKE